LVASVVFPLAGYQWIGKFAGDEIKVFAKIGHVFFIDRIRTTIPALVGHPRIVAGAVQTDAKISPASVAALTSSGQSGQLPFPAAFVAMARFHRLTPNELPRYWQPI